MTKHLTLIFIRHGLIGSNISKKYCGCRTDEDLCEEGIRQISDKRDVLLSLISDASEKKRGRRQRKVFHGTHEKGETYGETPV